MIEFFSDLIIE